jgi:hypothetical protein
LFSFQISFGKVFRFTVKAQFSSVETGSVPLYDRNLTEMQFKIVPQHKPASAAPRGGEP